MLRLYVYTIIRAVGILEHAKRKWWKAFCLVLFQTSLLSISIRPSTTHSFMPWTKDRKFVLLSVIYLKSSRIVERYHRWIGKAGSYATISICKTVFIFIFVYWFCLSKKGCSHIKRHIISKNNSEANSLIGKSWF